MNSDKINGGLVYKQQLDEVSTKVSTFVADKIRIHQFKGGLENTLEQVIHLRKGKNLMRPTLSWLTYKLYGGKRTIEEVAPLLAVSEFNNLYCYLDNWILDDKNNVGNDINQVRNLTIASQILREITQECIEEAKVNVSQRQKISLDLAQQTISCYKGQQQDLEFSYEKVCKLDSDEYLRKYLEKSQLQSGFLYGLSGTIGAILADEDSENISLTFNTLGTGLHVSNDLGDFAIFDEDGSFKPYQDQMADLRNNRIMFPAYYVLTQGTLAERGALLEMIGNENPSKESSVRVAKAIMTSGVYQETRKILNQFYNNYKRQLHQENKCPERDALSSVGEIIRYNKYLTALKKLN